MRTEEEIRAKALELAIAYEGVMINAWGIAKTSKFKSGFWDNVKTFRAYIENGKTTE